MTGFWLLPERDPTCVIPLPGWFVIDPPHHPPVLLVSNDRDDCSGRDVVAGADHVDPLPVDLGHAAGPQVGDRFPGGPDQARPGSGAPGPGPACVLDQTSVLDRTCVPGRDLA